MVKILSILSLPVHDAFSQGEDSLLSRLMILLAKKLEWLLVNKHDVYLAVKVKV